MKKGASAIRSRYSPVSKVDRPIVQTHLQQLLAQSSETTEGFAPQTLGPMNSGIATITRLGEPIGNSVIANRAHKGSGFTGAHRNGRGR